jgi:hypothetical protein
MTYKDYAKIQRLLGYIEGLIADCNTIVFDGITNAINSIDEIVDREMQTKAESEKVGEG